MFFEKIAEKGGHIALLPLIFCSIFRNALKSESGNDDYWRHIKHDRELVEERLLKFDEKGLDSNAECVNFKNLHLESWLTLSLCKKKMFFLNDILVSYFFVFPNRYVSSKLVERQNFLDFISSQVFIFFQF